MNSVYRFVQQAFIVAGIASLSVSAGAQTIIEEWASVKIPPAPEAKAVKVDPKTTALLVLDLVKQTCNNERRPRCVASVPKVAKLLADARANGMMVVHTHIPPVKVEDILPEVAPKAGEPVVVGWTHKFVGTDLEKILKDKGITTVIPVGTAAHGAVLFTGSEAVLRGFNVVLPVEGASAENQFAELTTIWTLANAPVVSAKVTITKVDMITY
jgi:nicotinamidase-related amidase